MSRSRGRGSCKVIKNDQNLFLSFLTDPGLAKRSIRDQMCTSDCQKFTSITITNQANPHLSQWYRSRGYCADCVIHRSIVLNCAISFLFCLHSWKSEIKKFSLCNRQQWKKSQIPYSYHFSTKRPKFFTKWMLPTLFRALFAAKLFSLSQQSESEQSESVFLYPFIFSFSFYFLKLCDNTCQKGLFPNGWI